MTLTELKHCIQIKEIPNILVFTGPELAIMDIYINQISKVTDLPITRPDTILDGLNKLRKNSFLVSNQLYVIRDDKSINEEKVFKTLLDNIKNNKIILIYSNLDKRGLLYKQLKSNIVEFEYLDSTLLTKYILKDLPTLDNNSCNALIEVCGNDYGRILLEIDKIKHYSESTNSSYKDAFWKLLEDGAIYCEPKDAIFELVDAILLKKISIIYNLLEHCYDYGESTLVILANLYSTAKQVLQVQACESKDVSRITGLSPWQIKQSYSRVNRYSNAELINMLLLIRKVERGIKTGLIEEGMSVDYLLVHIL